MFDTIFSFHTLEHLPNQIEVLKNLKNYINIGGSLIIEVPHANDFLLKKLEVEEFKEFTLWSQHLILHINHLLVYLFECLALLALIVPTAWYVQVFLALVHHRRCV